MNKIFNYFGFDGLKHILVSNAMVVVLNILLPLWIAVVLTAIVGVTKEVVWDKILGKGTPEKKDLIADAVGIVLGCF